MKRYREEWKEIDSVSRSAGWRAVAWISAGLLVIGAITAVAWMYSVATSDIKGQGDQTKIVNEAENRIASQEEFQELYNKILAYDRNLEQAAKDKAANPGDQFHATNYTGLKNQCNTAVGEYDALARKVTAAKWRSQDLPFSIDQDDPLTDCKENLK